MPRPAVRPAEADALVRLMRASWTDAYERSPFGVTLHVAGGGGEFTVTATLANGSARPWTAPRLALAASHGRRVRALDAVTTARLATGERLTVRWAVTGAAGGSDTWVTCRATANHAGATVTYTARTALG